MIIAKVKSSVFIIFVNYLLKLWKLLRTVCFCMILELMGNENYVKLARILVKNFLKCIVSCLLNSIFFILILKFSKRMLECIQKNKINIFFRTYYNFNATNIWHSKNCKNILHRKLTKTWPCNNTLLAKNSSQ